MQGLDSIFNHIGPFLMVLFRLSGLFVFAPAIASPIIPARVRVLLTMMFALAIYPTIPAAQQSPIELDWMSLGVAVAGETVIGLVVGLVAALPMYAVQLGGLLMGHQMGLGLANIYNPALDIEGDAIGQLLLYIALALFISMGGLDAMFLATARTFANVPVGSVLMGGSGGLDAGGGGLAVSSLAMLSGVVSSGFEIALRIAAPVLCIIMIETVATAFLMKTMPQLNIMSIGFATKALMALIGLVVALKAIGVVMHEDVGRTIELMLEWGAGLRLSGAAVVGGGG